MSKFIVKTPKATLCQPVDFHEAEIKLKTLKMIYPDAFIEPTEKEPVKEGFKLTAPPEEVEDKGCAGGACTL